MKKSGKVLTFDGYCGKIVTDDDKEYIMLKNEIIEDIKENDFVTFDAELFNDYELSKNIARFIRLIK